VVSISAAGVSPATQSQGRLPACLSNVKPDPISRVDHGRRDACPTILFDAVGTLLYADPPVIEVYHAAAGRFGSRLTADEIHHRFHAAFAAQQRPNEPTSEPLERKRWQRIVAAVFDDVPDASGPLFEQLWQHFAEPQHWRLYDDVAPALDALRRRGVRLGIASNFDRRFRAIAAGHSPLAACEHIFLSSEVGYSKPDPRFFAAVERELDSPPDQIVLVGDDARADFAGANAAGWQAVLIDRGPAKFKVGRFDPLLTLNFEP
jgi:putative hydrolase of the HAD superfamily